MSNSNSDTPAKKVYKLQYSNGGFTKPIKAKDVREAYKLAIESFNKLMLVEREALGHLTTSYVNVRPDQEDKVGICTEKVVNEWLSEHRINYKKSVLDDFQLQYEKTRVFKNRVYSRVKKTLPIPKGVAVLIGSAILVGIGIALIWWWSR